MLAVGCGSNQTGAGQGSGLGGNNANNVAGATLVAIQVTPAGPDVPLGGPEQFVATGIYSNGSSSTVANVVWTTSNATIAAINSTSGLATAGNQTGQATITATCGNISGYTVLTVTAASLTSVNLTPTTVSIPANLTQQFTLQGTYSDGSLHNVTSLAAWTSSNNATATVNSLGLATGVKAGVVNITASFQGQSATTTLTVTNATLKSVTVTSAAGASIANGTNTQLTATGIYSDGSPHDLTSTTAWGTSNSAIVNVSTTGLATSYSTGTVTVNATTSNVTGNFTLTVKPVSLVTFTVVPTSIPSLPLGTTAQLRAVGFYSDNSFQDLTNSVTWTTADNTTATVNNAGLVTPVNIASTTATAYVGPGTTGVNASSSLTVTNATLMGLIPVNSVGTTVTLGSNVTFTVNGTYSGGVVSPVTTGVLFSATPNITLPGASPVPAINNTTGVFNTIQTGTFNVTVSVNTTVNGTTTTLSNSTTITVIQPPTSGPMLFTGFFDGTISAFSLNPTTGVLSNVAGYPVAATSASPNPLPVWSILANSLQSMIYVSEFGAQNITVNVTPPLPAPQIPVPTTFTNVTFFGCNLPVAANGTVTTAAKAVDSQMSSTTSNITGDLAIVSGGVSIANLRTAVYCAGNGTIASASNVCLTPINGDGSLDTNAIDTVQLDTGTTVHAIAGTPNSPWFFTCGPNSGGTPQLQSLIAQKLYTTPSSIGVNLTSLTTDPSGVFLVGINATTGAANLALYTVNTNNGQITPTQQVALNLGGAPLTKVRTNGSLVAVLAQGSSQVYVYTISSGHTLGNSPGIVTTGPTPMDLDFDPTGQFLYVANSGATSSISAFAITNSTTATPTFSPISGSPFQSILPAGANITALKVFN